MKTIRFWAMFVISNLICFGAHFFSYVMVGFSLDSGGTKGAEILGIIPAFLFVFFITIGIPLFVVQKIGSLMVDRNLQKEERKLRRRLDDKGVMAVVLLYAAFGTYIHLQIWMS
ncbi:MAG: hypothetical protein ACRC28_00140 [Clostridium sp.]|uniref:hypothetical protein n=1 Tax=Clostridium sp. TaxID=1506 RepID=UPI003F3C0E62